jgi:tetratricopeptide (TPR) repeat protein
MAGEHLALGADSTQAWGVMTETEALKALTGTDAGAASRAEAALWEMWHRSGDRDIDALLREGIALMERRDLTGAETIFARVIDGAPEFAEGWNKRATVRYVAENYEGSIADCEQTLKRKPHHFGALSGQGICYMALGRHREAAAMFRRALGVHPHLSGVRHNLAVALGEAVRGNGH